MPIFSNITKFKNCPSQLNEFVFVKKLICNEAPNQADKEFFR